MCDCGPPRKAKSDPQRIVAAAWLHEGIVYVLPPPARHHHVMLHMVEVHGLKGRFASQDSGFLVEDGGWVTRNCAERMAFQTGQVTKIIGGCLTSEDLW